MSASTVFIAETMLRSSASQKISFVYSWNASIYRCFVNWLI